MDYIDGYDAVMLLRQLAEGLEKERIISRKAVEVCDEISNHSPLGEMSLETLEKALEVVKLFKEHE